MEDADGREEEARSDGAETSVNRITASTYLRVNPEWAKGVEQRLKALEAEVAELKERKVAS